MSEKEYIEREEVRDALRFITNDTTCPLHIAAEVEQTLDLIPAADVALVRHGHWIYGKYDIPHCSECGHEVKPNCISAFCPNCGAQMEGSE